jgi:hypothetical protein
MKLQGLLVQEKLPPEPDNTSVKLSVLFKGNTVLGRDRGLKLV